MKRHLAMILALLLSVVIHAVAVTRFRVEEFTPVESQLEPLQVRLFRTPVVPDLRTVGGAVQDIGWWIGDDLEASGPGLNAGGGPAVRPALKPFHPVMPEGGLALEQVEKRVSPMGSSAERPPGGLEGARELLGPLPLGKGDDVGTMEAEGPEAEAGNDD